MRGSHQDQKIADAFLDYLKTAPAKPKPKILGTKKSTKGKK